VHSSTVVRRTEAGNAELAVPAHGLSLAQRRFLTLLDTSCTVDELTHRHRAEAGKLDRDLTRLTRLGLVACDAPIPANDAALSPPTTVRLGASGPGHRLAYALLAVAVGALAWLAWQHWLAPSAATGDDAGATHPVQPARDRTQERPAADPQPIATRVLKSDPVERPRDGAKDAHAASKGAEGRTDNATAKARFALPVEHRSPPPDDTPALPVNAHEAVPPVPIPTRPSTPEPSVATPLPPSSAAMPLPASPAAPPAPATRAPGVPAATSAANAAPTTPRAIDVHPAAAPPTQLATAAPAAGLLRVAPAPAPPLVPIARESPGFPREAIAAGLSSGNVKARLTIDASGNVGDVAIVETSHRAFTRSVRDTLARWRFEPGAAGRTTMVDVAFKRD